MMSSKSSRNRHSHQTGESRVHANIFMSSYLPANLLAELVSLRPGAPGALPRIVVALPVAPSAPGVAEPARTDSHGVLRRLKPAVRVLAQAVLRNRLARRLAMAAVNRVPGLRARALGMLHAASSTIMVEAIPLAPALAAVLSPRARVAARRLQVAPAAAPSHHLPAPGDDAAWDELVATLAGAMHAAPASRPRLAFVSPLPPERTGIADYAVQLLPALCAWFDIDLVVQQETLDLPAELAGLPVRDSAWLRAHAHEYDRIVYQIGNSEFHSYMFHLLRDHPGVVVLHDFFLGNVMAYRQVHEDPPGAWAGALFHSHGFAVLQTYQQAAGRPDLLRSHPCNLAVLEQATAVIAHSTHAAELARTWYGLEATRNWHTAPLPRAAPPQLDRAAARAALGIAADVFLVCSFGYIGENKLTDRLLASWLSSTLHRTPNCLLVLVGANHDTPFHRRIAETVRSANGSVRIAGWSDDTIYRLYLQAADVGVQLRTGAQGETSAAVLDCMNYGLPTIVNANGSMAGLPPDAVLSLPDVFDDAALTAALETLHRDKPRRTALGATAAQLLASAYRPEHGAARYAAVLGLPISAGIEYPLGSRLAGQDDAVLASAAAALVRRPGQLQVPQLLIDIGSGTPPDGQQWRALLGSTRMRVELVRLVCDDGIWTMRYARGHAANLLGLSWKQPDDALADIGPGDVFYCQGLPAAMSDTAAAQFCHALKLRGAALAFALVPDAGTDWCARAPSADLIVCADAASADRAAPRQAFVWTP
jgi:glycosyltransferase involved in cell wall biosynthesis